MGMGWLELGFSAVVLGAAIVISFPTRRRLQKLGIEFATQHQAYVEPEFVDQFDRAQVREGRTRAMALVMTVAVSLLAPEPLGLSLISPGLYAVALAVTGVLQLARADREFVAPDRSHALTRPRAQRISDYIDPGLLWGCVVLAGFLLAAGVVAVRADVSPSSMPFGGNPTVVAVEACAVAMVMAAGLLLLPKSCLRSLPAVDAAHLYLHDAWRADQVEDAFHSFFGAALMLIPVAFAALPGWLWDSAVLPVVGISGLAWLMWADSRNKLRFRRRLWPTLQPGQVLRSTDGFSA